MGRVACETLVTTGLVVIAGEITTHATCGLFQELHVKPLERLVIHGPNMDLTAKPVASCLPSAHSRRI